MKKSVRQHELLKFLAESCSKPNKIDNHPTVGYAQSKNFNSHGAKTVIQRVRGTNVNLMCTKQRCPCENCRGFGSVYIISCGMEREASNFPDDPLDLAHLEPVKLRTLFPSGIYPPLSTPVQFDVPVEKFPTDATYLNLNWKIHGLCNLWGRQMLDSTRELLCEVSQHLDQLTDSEGNPCHDVADIESHLCLRKNIFKNDGPFTDPKLPSFVFVGQGMLTTILVLAMICMSRFKTWHGNYALVTFGAPRFAEKGLCKWIHTTLCNQNVQHWRTKVDPIPELPRNLEVFESTYVHYFRESSNVLSLSSPYNMNILSLMFSSDHHVWNLWFKSIIDICTISSRFHLYIVAINVHIECSPSSTPSPPLHATPILTCGNPSNVHERQTTPPTTTRFEGTSPIFGGHAFKNLQEKMPALVLGPTVATEQSQNESLQRVSKNMNPIIYDMVPVIRNALVLFLNHRYNIEGVRNVSKVELTVKNLLPFTNATVANAFPSKSDGTCFSQMRPIVATLLKLITTSYTHLNKELEHHDTTLVPIVQIFTRACPLLQEMVLWTEGVRDCKILHRSVVDGQSFITGLQTLQSIFTQRGETSSTKSQPKPRYLAIFLTLCAYSHALSYICQKSLSRSKRNQQKTTNHTRRAWKIPFLGSNEQTPKYKDPKEMYTLCFPPSEDLKTWCLKVQGNLCSLVSANILENSVADTPASVATDCNTCFTISTRLESPTLLSYLYQQLATLGMPPAHTTKWCSGLMPRMVQVNKWATPTPNGQEPPTTQETCSTTNGAIFPRVGTNDWLLANLWHTLPQPCQDVVVVNSSSRHNNTLEDDVTLPTILNRGDSRATVSWERTHAQIHSEHPTWQPQTATSVISFNRDRTDDSETFHVLQNLSRFRALVESAHEKGTLNIFVRVWGETLLCSQHPIETWLTYCETYFHVICNILCRAEHHSTPMSPGGSLNSHKTIKVKLAVTVKTTMLTLAILCIKRWCVDEIDNARVSWSSRFNNKHAEGFKAALWVISLFRSCLVRSMYTNVVETVAQCTHVLELMTLETRPLILEAINNLCTITQINTATTTLHFQSLPIVPELRLEVSGNTNLKCLLADKIGLEIALKTINICSTAVLMRQSEKTLIHTVACLQIFLQVAIELRKRKRGDQLKLKNFDNITPAMGRLLIKQLMVHIENPQMRVENVAELVKTIHCLILSYPAISKYIQNLELSIYDLVSLPDRQPNKACLRLTFTWRTFLWHLVMKVMNSNKHSRAWVHATMKFLECTSSMSMWNTATEHYVLLLHYMINNSSFSCRCEQTANGTTGSKHTCMFQNMFTPQLLCTTIVTDSLSLNDQIVNIVKLCSDTVRRLMQHTCQTSTDLPDANPGLEATHAYRTAVTLIETNSVWLHRTTMLFRILAWLQNHLRIFQPLQHQENIPISATIANEIFSPHRQNFILKTLTMHTMTRWDHQAAHRQKKFQTAVQETQLSYMLLLDALNEQTLQFVKGSYSQEIITPSGPDHQLGDDYYGGVQPTDAASQDNEKKQPYWHHLSTDESIHNFESAACYLLTGLGPLVRNQVSKDLSTRVLKGWESLLRLQKNVFPKQHLKMSTTLHQKLLEIHKDSVVQNNKPIISTIIDYYHFFQSEDPQTLPENEYSA
jgi:hypothetical protein